ncbi:MAG: UDP-N-acetylmuramate--L-alanine ligase [Candidatus Pacebacteria bacterium]|nr:UDP-N-acetylmuramate--L-alanine ligase [Candidatus Paceibacterota bacterium]
MKKIKAVITPQNARKIHFAGIGGIGISAVARMMKGEGKMVSGSDRDRSKVTDELKKLGIKISIGQKKSSIPKGCDLLVYTNALPKNHPELVDAKKRKIKVLSYPQTLHFISKEKYTIAISGTHGKTTTTAMVAKILMDAHLDPTVIVGSILKSTNSNFVSGKSVFFLVEADEYKRAFLNLEPKILAINNLDLDHTDYYKNLADIQKAFHTLAKKIPEGGFLICDKENAHLKPVLKSLKCTVIHYPDVSLSDWKLKLPGEHNRQNAKVAATVAGVLGVPEENIRKSLEEFEGTWRRFEFKGETKSGVLVYDDYAHNPEKVRAALAGAREAFPNKKIWAVFQPHLYSRTKKFLKEFSVSFGNADEVIFAPIFAAREKFDKSITSEMLAKAVVKKGGKAHYAEAFENIVKYLKKQTKKGDVVMTVGAGDIYKVGEELLK